MILSFNNLGLITPTNKILVPFGIVKSEFVDKFPLVSTRHKIYETFLKYLNDFQIEISENFEMFVDGSFVTKTTDPEDIDFVIFLDSEIFDSNEELIKSKYDRNGAKAVFGKEIDAFIVRKDVEGTMGYKPYKEAYAYWWWHFEKTRRDPRRDVSGIKQSKGFLEIIFTKSDEEE